MSDQPELKDMNAILRTMHTAQQVARTAQLFQRVGDADQAASGESQQQEQTPEQPEQAETAQRPTPGRRTLEREIVAQEAAATRDSLCVPDRWSLRREEIIAEARRMGALDADMIAYLIEQRGIDGDVCTAVLALRKLYPLLFQPGPSGDGSADGEARLSPNQVMNMFLRGKLPGQ
jgi:hypothetical protein